MNEWIIFQQQQQKKLDCFCYVLKWRILFIKKMSFIEKKYK